MCEILFGYEFFYGVSEVFVLAEFVYGECLVDDFIFYSENFFGEGFMLGVAYSMIFFLTVAFTSDFFTPPERVFTLKDVVGRVGYSMVWGELISNNDVAV